MPAKATTKNGIVKRSSTNGKATAFEISIHAEYDGTATRLANVIEDIVKDEYGYNQFGRFTLTVKPSTKDELEKALA